MRRFVSDHTEAICAAICADYGHRPRQETLLSEVVPVIRGIDHALKHLRQWSKPQRRGIDRLSFGLASNCVVTQPLGVVGVIVPWNFPLNLSFVPLTAIFTGSNRAMVKISENSRHLARLLIEKIPAYFPPGKLQFIDETGGVGVEFSKLPFDHLLFTGSGATGRCRDGRCGAKSLPCDAGTGRGRPPAVICSDFPMQTAVERILFVKCLNAGQICTTVDHVYLPRGQEAAFVAQARSVVPKRYSDLASKDYTSIINETSFDRLVGALDEARAQGTRLLTCCQARP